MPLTIGARGHAQMIPFGTGNGIISLISHDKLRWFLEDVGLESWGLELLVPNLEEKILERVNAFSEGRHDIANEIAERQDELWKVTHQNAVVIREAIS
jgi:polysaccharide pyruvyl transferase WcaK-like protein